MLWSINARPVFWSTMIIGLAGLAALILLSPYRPNTIKQNDSAAIGRLRTLYRSQAEYASAHPARGFACSLADIGGSDTYSGYTFRMSCGTASGRKAVAYQIMADPIVISGKKSGVRSYCVTERAVIWYDNDSAATCLAAQRPVPQ